MRTLIVAEGEHELSSALETLVNRLAPVKLSCELDRVSRNDIHAHHGKGRGFFKRVVRWMLEAEKRGYEAIILVIDEDGCSERTVELTKAQQYMKITLRRALGVAIRTFDAWMLADEKALTKVLGYQVSRQKDPETIKDPKGECVRLLGDCTEGINQRQMYAGTAEAADIETLAARCPKGFAPFAQRVRAL